MQKQIIIQGQGNIVSRWHFAHQNCDCYGFINYKTKQLQWEPTNAARSGANAVTAISMAEVLKSSWPDHQILQLIAD